MNADKPAVADLHRWFEISCLSSDPDSLADYVHKKLPTRVTSSNVKTFSMRVVEELKRRIHKCPARSPQQLRQWCRREINRIARKLDKREKARRRNEKPFRYEQYGEKGFIPLVDSHGNTHLWIIPADWLEWARKLWPVYVRRYPNGKWYVARKVPVQQPDGSRRQQEIGLHRLFAGLGAVKHNFDDAGEVQAKDGNWLNFANGNIQLIKGSDLLDHCRQIGEHDYEVADDWVPARRVVTTSPEGRSDRYNWHELSVIKWLAGGGMGDLYSPKTGMNDLGDEPDDLAESTHQDESENTDEDFC